MTLPILVLKVLWEFEISWKFGYGLGVCYLGRFQKPRSWIVGWNSHADSINWLELIWLLELFSLCLICYYEFCRLWIWRSVIVYHLRLLWPKLYTHFKNRVNNTSSQPKAARSELERTLFFLILLDDMKKNRKKVWASVLIKLLTRLTWKSVCCFGDILMWFRLFMQVSSIVAAIQSLLGFLSTFLNWLC